MAEPVEIKNLKKHFHTLRGEVHTVDDVSMTIGRGETMGVVGESGCGKSTLGHVPVRLEETSGRQILFRSQDITGVRDRALKQFRENVQVIFQDPYSSLNPRFTVEQTIRESSIIPGKLNRKEIEEETKELVDLVGIASHLRLSYPHELDRERRQRVGVARALALDPGFIVCDEPASAPDVFIQAQVLNLPQNLQQQKKLTYLFITHDLSVVRHTSDRISVMCLGQLVETYESGELFVKQLHPYTEALLPTIPTTDVDRKVERIILKGEITSPISPKPGCRFAAGCVHATPECRKPQALTELEPGHFVSCRRAKEINE